MDTRTLHVYESRAAEFCARYRAIEPRALYGLIEGFFLPGAPTADVGCGSGRDVTWLARALYTLRRGLDREQNRALHR